MKGIKTMSTQKAKQFVVAYREKKSRKKDNWKHEMYYTSLLVTEIDGKPLSYEDQFDLGWVRANSFIRYQERYFGKTLEYTILVTESGFSNAGEIKTWTTESQPLDDTA